MTGLLLFNHYTAYVFFSLIALARISSMYVHTHTRMFRSGYGGYPCIVSDFKKKTFNSFPLHVMLTTGFLQVTFVRRLFRSRLHLLKIIF